MDLKIKLDSLSNLFRKRPQESLPNNTETNLREKIMQPLLETWKGETAQKKNMLDDLSTVELNEVCSVFLQNKLPNKLKDPKSFTIPYLICSLNVESVLADLGARINVMSYKMFKQLGLGEPKPTKMNIQIADRSVRYPRGIIDDVLVKVDKFIFPIDFVVLDMDEDIEVPMIFGRPFLATSKTIIDVIL
ncbi:Transposon Ty3-I Gag-Pol polyprotein [Gossypium australe]|uniref:Transposon Ty3-I Gag-Pol polyprotein n=1 Tax=Gossypium australe TaxID=47621 RepID=A0A5B6VDG7_9ROSI|nr:Transposon Ty3-I Gag-Pol polyprotein [Gossypium australe]